MLVESLEATVSGLSQALGQVADLAGQSAQLLERGDRLLNTFTRILGSPLVHIGLGLMLRACVPYGFVS